MSNSKNLKSSMEKKEKKVKKELSIDDRLEQIIDRKKCENSALLKIFKSLEKEKSEITANNK